MAGQHLNIAVEADDLSFNAVKAAINAIEAPVDLIETSIDGGEPGRHERDDHGYDGRRKCDNRSHECPCLGIRHAGSLGRPRG